MFATNQARGVHVRQRARVGRDAFRRKQKNPFQEKVIVSISKGKRGLQSRKNISQTKTARSAPGRTGFIAH